jgi:hypothetical protein
MMMPTLFVTRFDGAISFAAHLEVLIFFPALHGQAECRFPNHMCQEQALCAAGVAAIGSF